jgi:sugar transferase (PEP-CTERM system associated)
MIRIFNLYVPTRKVLLVMGQIAMTCAAFALAVGLRSGHSSGMVLSEHWLWKILTVAIVALLCSHFLDLYDWHRLANPAEIYYRIFSLIGILSLLLAALTYRFPQILVGRNVLSTGLVFLAFSWILWHWIFGRLSALPILRERIYLLGDGHRARRIIDSIRNRPELGMDIIGWEGEKVAGASPGDFLSRIYLPGRRSPVDRVIVALKDRRAAMPVKELLELRMSGIRIEDGTSLLEKLSGQIEVDELHPSWLIFGDGFRLTQPYSFFQTIFPTIVALILSVLTLPLIPFVVVLIKLSSPGPVLYRQKRVGLRGKLFNCYKFRTMKVNAEADSGPTWATDDDPRITTVGRILRRTRIDEIPQLWNVLRGDMEFVGPRPERPEFVEWLNSEIPYYRLRHSVPPGITGWAQVCYKYGNTVQDAKEKLRYDLYYIKNRSIGLDFMIVLQTIKTVLLGQGC